MTPLGDACRVRGGDAAGGSIEAALSAAEVRIYVADDYGLLTPEQVEVVAAQRSAMRSARAATARFPPTSCTRWPATASAHAGSRRRT